MPSPLNKKTKVFGLINGQWIEGDAFADKQDVYNPDIYQYIGKASKQKIIAENGKESILEGEIFVFIHPKNKQLNTKH